MLLRLVPPLATSRRIARTAAAVGAAALTVLVGGCASRAGRFVWVDAYEAPSSDGGYLIAPGDLLAVRVWDNEKLSTRARVRDDGRITVPLLDDVAVAGRHPAAVARELEGRLRDAQLVRAPRVEVALDEATQVNVSVLGRVVRPGAYALPLGSGVAEALASAGGLTDFAARDRIFVLRRALSGGSTPSASAAGAAAGRDPAPGTAAAPEPVRIRFTFAAVTGRSPRAATFRLRRGDVIVAE